MPITIPADKALNKGSVGKTSLIIGVKTESAKYPYTTVGTAAKSSNAGLIHFLMVGPEYTAR